jgi:hypothetical protein
MHDFQASKLDLKLPYSFRIKLFPGIAILSNILTVHML